MQTSAKHNIFSSLHHIRYFEKCLCIVNTIKSAWSNVVLDPIDFCCMEKNSQKHSSTYFLKSFRFRKTVGWVNDDTIFIFGWTSLESLSSGARLGDSSFSWTAEMWNSIRFLCINTFGKKHRDYSPFFIILTFKVPRSQVSGMNNKGHLSMQRDFTYKWVFSAIYSVKIYPM